MGIWCEEELKIGRDCREDDDMGMVYGPDMEVEDTGRVELGCVTMGRVVIGESLEVTVVRGREDICDMEEIGVRPGGVGNLFGFSPV